MLCPKLLFLDKMHKVFKNKVQGCSTPLMPNVNDNEAHKPYKIGSSFSIEFVSVEQCPDGQHYLTCGTTCPLTCGLTPGDISCDDSQCEEGCFCKDESLYREGDRCINKDECGCTKDGFYYAVSRNQLLMTSCS